MLQHLSIKDFILIDDIELNFCPSLNIFTGETGSGKSILLNALSLLMGERASSDLVRHGANIAFINAEFTSNKRAESWLIENGFALEDDIILIKRSIDKSGKNRAHINGMASTGQQLKSLSKYLIEIQSQHAQQELLQTSEQRYILDSYANHLDLVDEVSNFYTLWQDKVKNLAKAYEQFEKDKENAEYLTWVMQDIEKLAPQNNEWQEIQNEHKKLQYSSDIIQNIQSMQTCLNGDDGIFKQIKFLQQKHNDINKFDSSLHLDEFIDALSINSNEMQIYLDKYLQRIEIDPARLQFLDERIHSWLTLSRRLKVSNEDLFMQQENLKQQLYLMDENFLSKLKQEVETTYNVYIQHAKKLSSLRKTTAIDLAKYVTKTIQELAMKEAIFIIDILENEPNEYGIDKIIFNLISHKNALPKPLNKIASGGELSRIALAITVACQTNNTMPSLFFDEIDSGISGVTAQKIGTLLAQIAKNQQVLCITHLAQVAAFADNHIIVNKISNDTNTTAHIYTLNASEKLNEIARLIGGDIINQDTLAHAQNLIDKSKIS